METRRIVVIVALTCVCLAKVVGPGGSVGFGHLDVPYRIALSLELLMLTVVVFSPRQWRNAAVLSANAFLGVGIVRLLLESTGARPVSCQCLGDLVRSRGVVSIALGVLIAILWWASRSTGEQLTRQRGPRPSKVG
jgi:hypothetical protein